MKLSTHTTQTTRYDGTIINNINIKKVKFKKKEDAIIRLEILEKVHAMVYGINSFFSSKLNM